MDVAICVATQDHLQVRDWNCLCEFTMTGSCNETQFNPIWCHSAQCLPPASHCQRWYVDGCHHPSTVRVSSKTVNWVAHPRCRTTNSSLSSRMLEVMQKNSDDLTITSTEDTKNKDVMNLFTLRFEFLSRSMEIMRTSVHAGELVQEQQQLEERRGSDGDFSFSETDGKSCSRNSSPTTARL